MRLRRPTRGLRWFFEHNDGWLMDKWLHYFDIYERHLDEYRGRPITLLEIGVSHGGSLQMWRRHANYWADYGGGRDEPGTFMAWTRRRIDDLHAFHSREDGFEPNEWTRTLGGLHVYDSVVVLDKTAVTKPTHRMTGRPRFDDVYGQSAEGWIDDDHRRQLDSLSSWPARLRRLLRDPRGTIDRAMSRVRR